MATASADLPDVGRMTLMEHLVELRKRLMWCALAVVVGAIACWVLYPYIFDILLEPYCNAQPILESEFFDPSEEGGCQLFLRDPLEGFGIRLTVAGYGGLSLAIPVVLWNIWRFVTPGLYAHEKRYAAPFLICGTILFIVGAGLAYWSIPRAFEFLLEIGGDNLTPLLSPAPYLSFVIKMMVAFGIGFQFPIFLIFLQLAGIISHTTLSKQRRFAIVGIVTFVAVLTPSGDPFTLAVLSVPMYLFYEIAIGFGWLRARRQRKSKAKSKA